MIRSISSYSFLNDLTPKSPGHFSSKNSPKLPLSKSGKKILYDVYFWISNRKISYWTFIWCHRKNLVVIHCTDSKSIVFEVKRKGFLSPCLGRLAHFDLAYLLTSTLRFDQIFYGCDPYVVRYMCTKFEFISSNSRCWNNYFGERDYQMMTTTT